MCYQYHFNFELETAQNLHCSKAPSVRVKPAWFCIHDPLSTATLPSNSSISNSAPTLSLLTVLGGISIAYSETKYPELF